MSSDPKGDAHTSALQDPRADGASDTPRSSQQKHDDTVSRYEKSEQKLLQALSTFLAEKGSGLSGLRVGDSVISGSKLWMAVMRAGGYDKVTAGKGWAAIGRPFWPPNRGTSDISTRVKKAYEIQLLPFEKAIRRGDIPDVTMADVEAAAKKALSVGGNSDALKAVKRERGPGDTAGRFAAKRGRGGGPGGRQGGRGGARAGTGGNGLIGSRILIKFDEENQEDGSAFYIGTIASFSKERHHVDFDDGDAQDVDLSEEVWRLATAEDEAEASQNHGKVPIREANDIPAGAADKALATTASDAGIPQQPRDGPSHASQLDEQEQRNRIQEILAFDGQDPDVVLQGSGYKVREGQSEGRPCYEIYVIVGAMNKEDVKVKCWPEGRVRIHGKPHPGIEKWTKDPVEHNIPLPSRIDPYSAKALMTLHGLLYISVDLKTTTSPASVKNA